MTVARTESAKYSSGPLPVPRKCQFIAAESPIILAHIRKIRTTDGLFCGVSTVDGVPYCLEHARQCYVPGLVRGPVPSIQAQLDRLRKDLAAIGGKDEK